MFPLHDDNPTIIKPVVTIGLIIICVLVYLWQFSLDDELNKVMVYSLGMIPTVLFNEAQLPPELYLVPAELTILSSMFMHGGFMHLAGNMLFLWVFGNNIEDSMGHGRFIFFYVLCGAAAALCQALLDPSSNIPMIGASGAISGILGAYLILHPHAKVLTVIPFIIPLAFRIPAMLVLGFWFISQIINSLASGADEAGVAWWAHISGFLAGLLLINLFKAKHIPRFASAIQSAKLSTAKRKP